jgi:hypothetical protein
MTEQARQTERGEEFWIERMGNRKSSALLSTLMLLRLASKWVS